MQKLDVIFDLLELCQADMAEEGFHDYTLATRLERSVPASVVAVVKQLKV